MQLENFQVSGASESATEESIESLQKRYLHTINNLLRDKPEHFLRLICHSILQRDLGDIAAKDLPFVGRDDDVSVTVRTRERFRYIAGLLLRKLDGLISSTETEYVSLADWIESEASLELRWLRVEFTSMRAGDIWHEFFGEYEDGLSHAVAMATYFIFQGVPAFQYDERRQAYVQLAQSTPLFHYLYTRGEEFDVVASLRLPQWATALSFKREHLRWHSVMFGNLESDDRIEILSRRIAFRNHIGLQDIDEEIHLDESSKWPWGNHETELLRLLAEAARKWWSNFDSSDNTTAPTNEHVSEWLQQRAVGKSMADKMATILRADGLPPGPRK